MIEVSIGSGAILAGSSPVEQRALLLYARHIGLAFQVADDILNVKGDPRKLGKAIGTDQRRGKNTYPSLLGLAGAEAFAGQLVNDAVKALDAFDNDADSLRSIARYVIERNR
jgi:geranylgeranyl diphosphate synthase type II